MCLANPRAMSRRGWVAIVKRVFAEFGEDGAVTQAASLAYYSALSMAPLVLLALWVAALVGPWAQQSLTDEITSLIGSEGGAAVALVVDNAREQPSVGNLSGIVSLLTLAFGATAVLAQLQSAMNHIWDVRSKPKKGVGGWLRKRLLSVGMLLALLFLLLVSTALSALLSAASRIADTLPGSAVVWNAVHVSLSILVFAGAFALMFRYLPDVRIGWRDVWFGALCTAVLFAIGKHLLGLYLGRGSVGSAYGAAGSLIVLLVWAYYSALIFLFGAEWTQVWARDHGRGIVPDEHAEPLDVGEAHRVGGAATGRAS
jgi:membrane protein